MKQKLLLKAMLLLCALVAGSSSVWATVPNDPKWVATALADISDGSTVIIISNSTQATNIALPSTTTSSNPAKKACTVSTTDGVTTITPPNGTTIQDLAWTLKKVKSNYKFYQEGSNEVRLYLTSISTNTALRVGNVSSDNDQFVLGSGGKLLKVTTGDRYVGPYDNNGSDWRTYNSETATNYKGAALTFYVLQDATKVATPTISPASGVVASGTEVTINCGTDDAIIYYTTDGTTPTSGSTQYNPESKPTITANTTIKAIGIKDGLTNSEVATATYTVLCATPTFSPAAGEVEKGTTVTISSATDGATIYYTTDGTTPTSESTAYNPASKPTITANTIIKAIGIKDGLTNSEVATAEYTIKKVETPTFSVAAGTVAKGTTVELATTTDGATIYYTTDGSTPTTGSTEYSSAITIDADMTIKAVAVKANWDDSDVASATYLAVIPASVTFDLATNIFSFPVGSENKTTGSHDYTYSGYTINLADDSGNGYYWNTSGYLLMGKTGCTLTFPAFPFNVSKIKVHGTSGASTSVTQNIFVGDDAVSTETTGAKDVINEYEIAAGYQAAGNVYKLKLTSNHNTQISKIEIFGYATATIAASGLSSFCSESPLDLGNLPTGLKAYQVTTASGTKATMSEVTTAVVAGTGLILEGAGGSTYNIPVVPSGTNISSTNKLVGVTNPAGQTIGGNTKYDYILKSGKFYRASEGTIDQGKAYLHLDSAPASELSLDFDGDDITGIDQVKSGNLKLESSEIYNLNGQRVAQPTKGLYIVNGKKVIIK